MTVVGRAQKAVKGTPLEPAARHALHAISRTSRRDHIDNRHLRLLLAFVLRPDSDCVDVGANKGTVLREMVRLAPHGTHVAFEPIPVLAENLAERFPEVTVRQAAVSDRPGTARFQVYTPVPAMSSLNGRPDLDPAAHRETVVRTVTLDGSLERTPSLLKIDVEGAEGLVLRGATEVLKARPWVWFEHSDKTARTHDSSADEVYEHLTRAGLRIFDADGHGPYTLPEFRRPPRIWTFLAR